MKFNHIQVYGSAGGIGRKGDITAHIVASEVDTVEEVRAAIAALPDLIAAAKALAPMFDNDAKLLQVYELEIRDFQAALAMAGAA